MRCAGWLFTELSDLPDRLITSADTVLIVGDLNIRLDRPNDSASRRLLELFASYGLSCCVSSPTHDRGGHLDVVLTRADSPVSVDVIDPASLTIGCCAGHTACTGRRQCTRQPHTVRGDASMSTSSATNCVSQRSVAMWPTPTSTHWRS